MNRTQLITAVGAALGESQAKVEAVIKQVEMIVADTLKAGEEVQLSGFGTFKTSEQAAREGRNPATGEKINIPASKRVSFSASDTLKAKVK